MSVELISSIFTGAVGLLTGVAGLNFQRNRRLERSHRDLMGDFKTIRAEVTILRKLDLAKTRHIFAQDRAVARGGAMPSYPEEINELERQLEAIENSAIERDDDDHAAA